ncbi:MAG: hypothetical protein O6922_04620 [Chloroflexi bacterium]|nr:hypothetical protein [Chloroflexota bacterium]
MLVRTIWKALSGALNSQIGRTGQRGIAGVTIAVLFAALAVVSLTIVQATMSAGATSAQDGIPGLLG